VAIWPFRKKPKPYVPTSAEIDAYLAELRRRREAGELTRARYDEPPDPATTPPRAS
jgi:hypothetical protein